MLALPTELPWRRFAGWLLMVADSAVAFVATRDRDALVADLFAAEGANLVRLARIFTDDRNAAEDLVQEAFIRLHRAAHRIKDPAKAAPYHATMAEPSSIRMCTSPPTRGSIASVRAYR